MNNGPLAKLVTDVVTNHPGQDKHQLIRLVAARGGPVLSRTELNRLLYGIPEVEYRVTTGSRRCWYPRVTPLPIAAPVGSLQPHAISSALRGLRSWQIRALKSWVQSRGSGVIEAVTGAGKTRVGLAAADVVLSAGGQVVVVVPTIALQKQWMKEVKLHLQPGIRIGQLGGNHGADLSRCDLLIAVAASASNWSYGLQEGRLGLLIADECHRYGSEKYQRALEPSFEARLGLTATYEREDSAIDKVLDPYFGGLVYSLGYDEALSDEVIADFKIAFIGVPFDPAERQTYDELTERLSRQRRVLLRDHGVPENSFPAFMQAVTKLKAAGVRAAGLYLSSFNKRRQLMSCSRAKLSAVTDLAPATRIADRSIMFTQDCNAANEGAAAMRAAGVRAATLDSTMSLDHRTSIMVAFENGEHDLVVAPKLLDEGIDVPAADLAIVLATSRSRRQLVQRMGRVLRLKDDGRLARLAILYVRDTFEDPAAGAHEDFIGSVVDAASDVQYFDSTRGMSDACSYLCSW